LCPSTAAGKLVTIVFVIVGVAAIGWGISQLAGYAMDSMQNLEDDAAADAKTGTTTCHQRLLFRLLRVDDVVGAFLDRHLSADAHRILNAVSVVLVLVFIGVLFYTQVSSVGARL
jgi:hypothetical protein